MLLRFKKFVELSWNEQLLFSEALFLQLSIGFILKVIPFRWIPRLFTGSQSTSNRQSPIANQSPHASRLYQIKAATQRASLISPWRNKCLIQSLAARRMLNRRNIPSQLSLGVAKGRDSKTVAHAWLKAGDFEIVEKTGDFSELFRF